jgi:hypothetical protein
MLVDAPAEMGFSYPANAYWRLWALGKAGRADVIVKDLRERWATMDSVRLNNTLQEFWTVKPDSIDQWSHCAVVPLALLYMSIAGIAPVEPGFTRYRIRPQPADLQSLDLTAHTPKGPIGLRCYGTPGNRDLILRTPVGADGSIVLDGREKIDLTRLGGDREAEYRLPSGAETHLHLRFT